MIYLILALVLFWSLWQLNIYLKSDKKKSLTATSTECDGQKVEVVKNENDSQVEHHQKLENDEKRALNRKLSSETLKPILEERCNIDEVEVIHEGKVGETEVGLNPNKLLECVPAVVEDATTECDIDEGMRNELAGNKIAKEITEEIEEVDVEVEVRTGNSEEKESVVTSHFTTKQEQQQKSEIHVDEDGNVYRKVVENFEDGEMGTPHIIKEFEDVSCEKNVVKTVVVKQVKNVSFSKEEFRTRSVEVKSVLSSNIVQDYMEDGLQKPIISFPNDELGNANDVKETVYVKTGSSEHVSTVSSVNVIEEECEANGQTETDEDSPRKKKPFGGICMFGGEELLKKIEKRRMEVDSNEQVERKKSETSGVTVETFGYTTSQTNNTTHHETFTLTSPVSNTDPSSCNQETHSTTTTTSTAETTTTNQAQPDIISSDSKLAPNGKSESDLFESESTTNKEVHSIGLPDFNTKLATNLNAEITEQQIPSLSSLPDNTVDQMTSEGSSANDMALDSTTVEGTLSLPSSELHLLTHLNKDRPRGPVKRKPSFQSGRNEQKEQI